MLYFIKRLFGLLGDCFQIESLDNAQFHTAFAEGQRNFAHTCLVGVDFNGVDLRGLSFYGADLRQVCNLPLAHGFAWANWQGANLVGVNLSEIDFQGANLSLCNLKGSNLHMTDLQGANLSGANLSGANLSWSNLNGANLAFANLRGANCAWADLYGTHLKATQVSLAELDTARLPYGTNLIFSFTRWK